MRGGWAYCLLVHTLAVVQARSEVRVAGVAMYCVAAHRATAVQTVSLWYMQAEV